MEMVVVLPAPLPPSSAVTAPSSRRKVDAVHGGNVAIDLAQGRHLNGRRSAAMGGRHRLLHGAGVTVLAKLQLRISQRHRAQWLVTSPYLG